MILDHIIIGLTNTNDTLWRYLCSFRGDLCSARRIRDEEDYSTAAVKCNRHFAKNSSLMTQ